MPSMSVQVVQRGQHSSFGAAIAARRNEFLRGVADAQKKGTQTATDISRRGYKRMRPVAPARPGRDNESMTSFITWRREQGKPGVYLDVARLDQNAPHWIIQEIGTGNRASMRQGGVQRGPGRPSGSSVRTVKPQRGRKISPALVWSSGGRYAAPRRGASGQQLAFASSLSRNLDGSRAVPFRSRPMVIGKEIVGQHFVKKGAESGFREYHETALAAARKAFRKGGSL